MRLAYTNLYLPQASSLKEKAKHIKISEIYMYSAQMRKGAGSGTARRFRLQDFALQSQTGPLQLQTAKILPHCNVNVKAQEISGGEV